MFGLGNKVRSSPRFLGCRLGTSRIPQDGLYLVQHLIGALFLGGQSKTGQCRLEQGGRVQNKPRMLGGFHQTRFTLMGFGRKLAVHVAAPPHPPRNQKLSLAWPIIPIPRRIRDETKAMSGYRPQGRGDMAGSINPYLADNPGSLEDRLLDARAAQTSSQSSAK